MKSQFLRRKPMKARFKLPIDGEHAVLYLSAAISAEVEYRNQAFLDSDDLDKQVASVAHWLCGMSNKNSLLLAGGCGNGKTTFVYAMQNILNHIGLKNPVTGQYFYISLYNAKDLANICKTRPKDWRSIMDKDLLAIDDLGIEPREIIEYGNVLSPIIDLISYRYDRQLPTIITSNLTPQQISEVYGKRIGDRLKETTEIVPFLNASYRGGNATSSASKT